MTIDQHLRILIGDLVITVARLSAENDALKAAAPPPPPEPPPPEGPA
jgi:hypothetical protein